MLDVSYHVSATAVPPAPSLEAAEYFELWSRVASGGCAVLGRTNPEPRFSRLPAAFG
jgi:hypothetical protein